MSLIHKLFDFSLKIFLTETLTNILHVKEFYNGEPIIKMKEKHYSEIIIFITFKIKILITFYYLVQSQCSALYLNLNTDNFV